MFDFEHQRDRRGYRIYIRHPLITHVYAVYCENHGINPGWTLPYNKRIDFEMRVLKYGKEIVQGKDVDEYFIH